MNAIRHPRPVAIVTGGAGLGIGHGISEALVHDGWDLVVTDKDAALAAALRERLGGGSATIEVVVADVTEPSAPERSVAAALERFGRLDGLVNNVGVGLVKNPGDVSDEEFMGLFQVDFLAAFRLVRAALPALVPAKGAIVNIGSVHARLAARKYAVAFLLGKRARSITGQSLLVDGGTTVLLFNNDDEET